MILISARNFLRTVVLGASAWALATAGFAQAGPASQDEAQRIQASLERYLGKPREGGGGAVTVTPAGRDYTVSINLEELARPLGGFGVSVQSPPVTMTVTPQSGALWRVVQAGMPEVSVRIKEQNMRLRIDGFRFDGVYDANLMAFMSAKSTQTGTSVDSIAPGMMNVRRDGPTTMELISTATPSGAVSAAAKGRTESHNQSFRITQGGSDIAVSFTTGVIDSSVTLDAVKMQQLAAIWAFFVANASEKGIQDNVDELKQAVRNALPLFDAISQDALVSTIAVTSPVGNFALKQLGMTFSMTGVRKEGKFGLNLSAAGLTLPEALLPPWSAPLIPDDIVLDFKASGYDLETVANTLLDVMRPGTPGDEAQAAGRNAVQAAFPDGKTKVAFGPSRLVSKLLTVTFEGELTVFRPIPRGKLTVRARGVDAAIEHLQKTGAGDKNAAQGMMALIGAKGFGKNEPDGSLVWVIENPDGGMPTINGASIPGMGGKK